MLVRLALAAVLSSQGAAPALSTPNDSTVTAARPWHTAERWRRTVARESAPSRDVLVAGARAQLAARRFEHTRSLLAGQPWLAGAPDALGLIGEAELALGMHRSAAERFAAARRLTAGALAALFAVREAVAHEAGGSREDAVAAWRAARATGLAAVEDWLRLREARVTDDTAAAHALLGTLGPGPAREAGVVWAAVLLGAGDSAAAQRAYAGLGRWREAIAIALGRGDTVAARTMLYGDVAPGLRRDLADMVRELAALLPPHTAAEFVILARALRLQNSTSQAVAAVRTALARGDSTGPTLLLAGDLLADAGRLWPAERAYRAAVADPAVAPLATYRRARILARIGDPGAVRALAGFADTHPGDSAAPSALYFLAAHLTERGDATADRWYGELIRRYPDARVASLARFRLAEAMQRGGRPDSAAALYRDEVRRAAAQERAARFALGRLARARGDTADARLTWTALAARDSLDYYGLRARMAAGLPPPAIRVAAGVAAPPSVVAALARLDTLRLARLDSAVVAEVRALVEEPPRDRDALLALSRGLTERGFGAAGVRLGWVAFGRAPADPEALRAVFPWPNRDALAAEAREFGIDPVLFAALVRQESVFATEAESRAGARGLAQLLPTTAAEVARRLAVTFEPEWLGLPDLNLHLGSAHLAHLINRFDGRIDAALAAYNAGATPVRRWLSRPGMDDPDEFVELIPYRETRGYVRAVQRNRWLYAALYPEAVE